MVKVVVVVVVAIKVIKIAIVVVGLQNPSAVELSLAADKVNAHSGKSITFTVGTYALYAFPFLHFSQTIAMSPTYVSMIVYM